MHATSGPNCPLVPCVRARFRFLIRVVVQVCPRSWHPIVPCLRALHRRTYWVARRVRSRSCCCDRQIRAVRPTRNMHSCSFLILIRVVVRVCPRSWNPIVPCIRALHRRTTRVARCLRSSTVAPRSSEQGSPAPS